MKYLPILLLIMATPALAATCYGSADCQRQMNQQIRENSERHNEEVMRRNEQIEQDRRMREMIENNINN